jgi:hypothetical protein
MIAPDWLSLIARTLGGTLLDVLPIVVILGFFQLVVLRQKIPNPGRMAVGSVYVVIGLALFLVGLEQALFPLGSELARQLTDPEFLGASRADGPLGWADYYWVHLFAA